MALCSNFDPRSIVSYSVARAYWLLRADMGTHLKNMGIKGHSVNALWVIAQRGETSQQDLARELAIDQGTLVSVIDELTEKGALRKEINPKDRRVNLLSLTEVGIKLLEDGLLRLKQHEEHVFSSLTASEHQLLGTLLEKVNRSLGGQFR